MAERVELWLSGPLETAPDWLALPDMLHRLGLTSAAASFDHFDSVAVSTLEPFRVRWNHRTAGKRRKTNSKDPAFDSIKSEQGLALSYRGQMMALRCGLSGEALGRACDGPATVIGLAAAPSPTTHWFCVLQADPPDGPGQVRTALAQRLCVIAALLAPVIGADAMLWPPARLWSATAMLRDAVVAMEQSELPPVLHLVAFTQGAAYVVGRCRLMTRGLSWFAGHEVVLNFSAALPIPAALRRISRLAIDAMTNGAIVGPMTVSGIDRGELMRIGVAQNRSGEIIVPVELTVR